MTKYICILCFLTNIAFGGEARFSSMYTLPSGDENLGGLSSIHVSDDGSTFIAITDRGYFVSGEFERRSGRLNSVNELTMQPLRNRNGEPFPNGMDSEGIAIDINNRIYVSFEGQHRVRAYASTNGKAVLVPAHDEFKKLQSNSGLEALAIDHNGWLYAIPERSGIIDKPFPVYRFIDHAWDKRLSIPRRSPFLVVGADFGPDKKLYVLERDFKFPTGFATRIRRFTLTGAGFQNEEILLESPLGKHGNLEGISVWQDDQKRTRITLIADNNFKFFLRNMLVEYVID